MKKTEKALFALGTAALVGVAAYGIIRKKSKEFYENYYKSDTEPLEVDTWLTKMPRDVYHIKNSQGLDLVGYHIPKENAKFTMVIIHGYHSRALNMNNYARAFYEYLDCDLFLPDLRGHLQQKQEKRKDQGAYRSSSS